MQRAPTDLMIFDIPTIIEYLTGFTELLPGDVIATGTPGGVGFKREPPVFMKAGDVAEHRALFLGETLYGPHLLSRNALVIGTWETKLP